MLAVSSPHGKQRICKKSVDMLHEKGRIDRRALKNISRLPVLEISNFHTQLHEGLEKHSTARLDYIMRPQKQLICLDKINKHWSSSIT